MSAKFWSEILSGIYHTKGVVYGGGVYINIFNISGFCYDVVQNRLQW